jgi:hypothetical protein
MSMSGQIAVKLHPANGIENSGLLGWVVCRVLGSIPPEFEQSRRVLTRAGDFLVLVCHEAVIFTGRSRLKDPTKLLVRNYLRGQAIAGPRPDFTLIATHCLTRRSGPAFKDAASKLADLTRGTIVTTMFAPRGELDLVAQKFPVVGPQASRVATLFIEGH